MAIETDALAPPEAPRSYKGPLAYAISCFLIWGLAYGLLDVLNKHFQETLHVGKAQSTLLQMAYFGRARNPVIMDIGPVLHPEDVVGGKVCALASRALERDYVDTAAALAHYSVDQLIEFAQRLDPGLTDQDFADAGRRLDRMHDDLFARYGLAHEDIARLRRRLAGWPRVAPPREA